MLSLKNLSPASSRARSATGMGAVVLVFVIRAGCAEVRGHREMGGVKKDLVLGSGFEHI
jgi:hypothetical protein